MNFGELRKIDRGIISMGTVIVSEIFENIRYMVQPEIAFFAGPCFFASAAEAFSVHQTSKCEMPVGM